jgi:hypothetical protein
MIARFLSLLPLVAAGFILVLSAGRCAADDWALLVGASEYPNWPKERWLRGPTNDVELMRRCLLDKRHGFREDHITALCGWPTNAAARPTRANILQAMERLQTQCRKGDQAFVLFSGHGAQQPDRPSPDDIEPDGLDEIILPADAGIWDEKAGGVQNAILDDELRVWSDAMVKKGVLVWMVFDSCHSGTMTRDVAISERQLRRVDMRELMPPEVLGRVRLQGAQHRGTGLSPGGALDLKDPSGGLVAIYAAQPFETTFETPLPGKDGEVHGLLTYMIAKSLEHAEGKFTYRQLADRLTTLYRTLGVSQPTPFIEGAALERIVLGRETREGAWEFLIQGNVGTNLLVLAGGELHGLRPGTILEAFPPAGLDVSGELLGHVRVKQAGALAATVFPCAYAGRPAPAISALGLETRCRVVQEDIAMPPLRVAVQTVAGTSGEATVCAPDRLPRPIAAAFGSLAGRGLVSVTNRAEDADWFLRLNGKQGSLVPGTGWQAGNNSAPPPAFLVGDPTDEKTFPRALEDRLTSIARALRLLRIAGSEQPGVSRQGATRVTVDLLRYDTPDSPEGKPVVPGPAGRTLCSGDTIAFRMKNPCGHPIDVTLLFVDSGYGIQALFPETGTVDDNRLFPGQERTTPKVTVTADTVGSEQLVVIAVKASLERVDFSCLQQSALERTRSTRALGQSPLGELLVEAMFAADGATRGLKRAGVPNHHTLVIPWQTLPAQ